MGLCGTMTFWGYDSAHTHEFRGSDPDSSLPEYGIPNCENAWEVLEYLDMEFNLEFRSTFCLQTSTLPIAPLGEFPSINPSTNPSITQLSNHYPEKQFSWIEFHQ
jgi:hypothetical protein